MAQDISKKWIVGLSGSEWDDVCVYSFEGTKSQAKKMLADIVKADRKEDDRFDYGTTKVSEIVEDQAGVLHAASTFSSYHNDYTATPLDSIRDIVTFTQWTA